MLWHKFVALLGCRLAELRESPTRAGVENLMIELQAWLLAHGD
jgi:hypothetical protein